MIVPWRLLPCRSQPSPARAAEPARAASGRAALAAGLLAWLALAAALGAGALPAAAAPAAGDAPAGAAPAALAAADSLVGAGAAPRVLRLVRAADTLGRDISGQGQALSPGASGSRPLLVQVLDGDGDPVNGVGVVFQVEPGFDPQGNSHYNGGLHPLQPAAGDSLVRYAQRGPRLTAESAAKSLRVASDKLGYAGVYFYPGPRVETVRVTAWLEGRRAVETSLVLRVIDPRWQLLLWSGLLGGLALFLVGMRMTTSGLEQVAGNRMRAILGRVTEKRWLGLVTGVAVTALIQSSSATTVMVVSFTNAGLLSLRQTLAIILGADIGTTLTVQLIAFSLKDYSLLIVFAGFILSALPQRRYRSAGQFLLGCGLIFYGMGLMSRAMDPLRDNLFFRQLLVGSAERPLLVLIAAMIFTALIHNSAAAIGIALTLAFQGLIGLPTAIPVILGANIGTCATAIMAAFGARREARRVALAHVFFKVAAVCLFLPFIKPFAALVAQTAPDVPRQIANAHTLFNVTAALVFLPSLSVAERFLRRLVPDAREEEQKTWRPKYLDERILELPVMALAQTAREISRLGDAVLRMLREGYLVIRDRDEERMRQVVALDDKVDVLESELRRYLIRLGRTPMDERQSAKVASYLYMIHHLETIGDLISKNLMGLAQKVIRDDLRFSAEGAQQWTSYYEKTLDMLQMALAAFATNDQQMARQVVAQKAIMARQARALHFEHLDRLGQGIRESEQSSPVHIHLIADLRRIVSNAASVAAAVVHEYRLPDHGEEPEESDLYGRGRPSDGDKG